MTVKQCILKKKKKDIMKCETPIILVINMTETYYKHTNQLKEKKTASKKKLTSFQLSSITGKPVILFSTRISKAVAKEHF